MISDLIVRNTPFSVPGDRFKETARRLERDDRGGGLRLERIATVDDGLISGPALVAPYLSSYRTMNDSWSRGMTGIQWTSLLVALICAPLSHFWWPAWTGVIAGFVVAIVAGLAKRREQPKSIEDPHKAAECTEARGSRPIMDACPAGPGEEAHR